MGFLAELTAHRVARLVGMPGQTEAVVSLDYLGDYPGLWVA